MSNTKDSPSENIKNMLVRRRKFLIVVAAFALLGAALLSRSQAATYSTAIEAESGTVAGNAGAGVTAGASGTASVKFGLGGLNPNPNPFPIPAGPSYYVDCQDGSDSNSGTSEQQAIKSL